MDAALDAADVRKWEDLKLGALSGLDTLGCFRDLGTEEEAGVPCSAVWLMALGDFGELGFSQLPSAPSGLLWRMPAVAAEDSDYIILDRKIQGALWRIGKAGNLW